MSGILTWQSWYGSLKMLEIGNKLLFLIITSVVLFVIARKRKIAEETRGSSDYREDRQSEETVSENNHLKSRIKLIETILHAIPVGIAVNDTHGGKLMFMNEKYSSIFGWPGDDLTNLQHFFKKLSDDGSFRNNAIKQFLEEMQGGKQKTDWDGIEIKTKAGKRRFIDISNIPVVQQNLMISLIRDVTRQKENQQKIKESEEKFRAMFENSLTAMVILNDAGDFIDANQACEKLLGYEIDVLKQMNVSDINTPLQNQARKIFGFLLKEKKNSGEFTFTDKNKVEHTALYHAVTVSQNFHLAVLMDITERKRNEQRLDDTARLLEKTLAGIGDAVMVINPADRSIILANPAVEKIFGYHPDEIIGRNTKFLHINSQNYKDFGRVSEKALEQNGHFFGEYAMRKKDGTIIETENTVNAIYDENGWQTGVVSIVRDITELKHSRMRLKSITDNLPGAVIRYELKPDGTDAMTYVSGGAERIWGVTAQEAMNNNQRIWDQIDKRDIENVKKFMQKSAENLSTWSIEFRNHHPDHSVKWLLGIGLPRKQADGSVVWDSLMLDITQRKEAEEEIRKYQQSLRDLTTEISLIEEKQRKEIAANIHDNLSQLLVVAKMKLSDLQNKIENEQAGKNLSTIIEYITKAIEHSRNITYDLSPPVLYELGLIEAVYWLSEKIRKEHNLEIDVSTEFNELQLPESKLIIVYRVIQELFNNIIKHARASAASVIFKKVNTGVKITISDNGIGFSADAASGSAIKHQGFGMFAIKERIINLAGDFNITSVPGGGTIVTVFIPVEQ
jgi:PAS domain S-box-containing protein